MALRKTQLNALLSDLIDTGSVDVSDLSRKDLLWAFAYCRTHTPLNCGTLYKRHDELTGLTELVTEFEDMVREYLLITAQENPDMDQVRAFMERLWTKAHFSPKPRDFI